MGRILSGVDQSAGLGIKLRGSIMRMRSILHYGAAPAALAFALLATPALAQEEPDQEAAVDVADEDEEIIQVTGTRIQLPNLQPTEPTTTIDSDFISSRNFINVADALNELPSIRGSVTPDGGQAGFGQGVNFVNIFALGSNRTLTLVNGRRVVSSNVPNPFSAGAPGIQVDLNIIPTALIKRVDQVSTAGAPIYGSDAIAGTVNVILDDQYEGLSLNATSGITEQGDNFNYRLEGVYGTSFADGRGHIQISSFYTETNGVLQNQRQFFRDNVEFEPNTIPQFRVDPSLGLQTPGPDGDTDGVPAQVLFNSTNLFILSNGGVISGGPLGISAAPGALNGLSGAGAFQFDPTTGNLVPFNVGVRPLLDTGGTAATGIRAFGGDGFQFVDFGQLTSDLRRFGANIFANYDITDNINVFTELQYYDARADELVQQPTFNSPFFGGASSGLTFSSDNPFLNDQARGVLAAAGVDTFTVSRANVGIADLTGFAETEFLRGVLGTRGNFELFNNDWNFEAAFTYGQSTISDFRQDINAQNFINATNVTTDAAGNIVCDPNPATPVQAGQNPVADANCVPFNFFGNLNTPEAIAYVVNDNLSTSVLEQIVFNVNVGGTLFEFNGNPVAINVGYEHRDERGAFNPSEFTELGLGRAVAIPAVQGGFNLDEVFGELVFSPISPDNESFIYSIDTYARGRYVDNTVNGGFFSWALGGAISPIEDITIRGNFTRSFRAPAISELFSPQGTAFAAIPDLCFAAAIDGGPNPEARRRNCEAFLAAFPNISRPQLASQATVPIFNGGNPNLQNEQADSWTIGGIIRPRFIPNLSITVDYINIEISDPIGNLGAAAINAACFDNDNFDVNDPANGNQFCSLIGRDANGEVPNDPANPAVTTGQINGNAIEFEGIQGELNYRTSLDGLGLPGNLSLRGLLTVTLRRQIDFTGVAPARSDGEVGDPQFEGLATLNYINDNYGFGTTIDYVGEQLISRFNRTPDQRQFDQIEDYVTVDFNTFFRTEDNFTFNFTVRNLFDRQCQELNGFCIPASIDDVFGRRFSVSVTKEF
ncbi:TonB-dependent receptor domain-containing protein [Parasphingorhabdus sp. DH2-15]|uniref:TonB-dependent receptor domain-containing protein n=1 Tax=Parasphingorhabdus sp. DH2-15 TaxID=3444112 RepID=UPI003F688A82